MKLNQKSVQDSSAHIQAGVAKRIRVFVARSVVLGSILLVWPHAFAAVLKTQVFDEPVVSIDDGALAKADQTAVETLMGQTEAAIKSPAGQSIEEKYSNRTLSLAQQADALESFVQNHPESPWSPSLKANLGRYYRANGRYTLALDHWESAWLSCKDIVEGPGKHVADYSLAHWTRLLASLGRLDTLTKLITENQNRVLDQGPLSQMWVRTREAYVEMRQYPGISYRCGTYALANVAFALKGNKIDFGILGQEQSPSSGFSLQHLVELSEKIGLNLKAVRRLQGQEIVVPSVVHWAEGHYAAIIAKTGDRYLVVDPTFEYRQALTADVISAEASGAFLVPLDKVPKQWQSLSAEEASNIFGRGNPNIQKDPDNHACDEGCPPGCPAGTPGTGGSPSKSPSAPSGTPLSPPTPPAGNAPGSSMGGCCGNAVTQASADSSISSIGMPIWFVAEPYINLWIEDEPLGYQPALGPRVSFKLWYKQRDELPPTEGLSVGSSWHTSWLSYLIDNPGNRNRYGVTYFSASGGRFVYEGATDGATTVTNYNNNLQLRFISSGSGVVPRWELIRLDGSKDIYGYQKSGTEMYFLSEKVDPAGNKLSFSYSLSGTNAVIDSITDGDGRTTSISYYSSSTKIHQVTDGFGRTATLTYTGDLLTGIEDTGGLSTTFAYDMNGTVYQMTTPYGTTTFFTDDKGQRLNNPFYRTDRSVTIAEPNGSRQLYTFIRDCSGFMGNSVSTNLIPQSTPIGTLDTSDFAYRNSFYWNRAQFLNLSSTNVDSLLSNDYLKGRMRHWFGNTADDADNNALDTISIERDPSPDAAGTIDGQLTWYDYPGKGDPAYNCRGTTILPWVIARRLSSGGPTWYEYNERNELGVVTNITSTYTTDTNGTVGTRTEKYERYSNGIDLWKLTRADNMVTWFNVDTNYHQVLAVTNTLGTNILDTTYYNYDSTTRQLTNIIAPNGQNTYFLYYAMNDSTNRRGYLKEIRDVGLRTNTFDYVNGLVSTHTDERNLTVTTTWDNLQRPLVVQTPEAVINNNYTYLDLTETIHSGLSDSINTTNTFTYNSIRQLQSQKDANGNVTAYGYCDCGALNSITNALGTTVEQVTTFVRDNQGRITDAYFPGRHVSNGYNLLGQLTNQSDSISATSFTYNNQGLRITASTGFGQISSIFYDIQDRPSLVTDANGVTVSYLYDGLDRVTSRSYPDTGVEYFYYSPNILRPTIYTNQVGNITTFDYDGLNRLTTRVFPGYATNRFAYAFGASGETREIIDGNNHTTTLKFDQYGRLSQRLDDNGTPLVTYGYSSMGWVTDRTNALSQVTRYTHDNVGNVLTVNYVTNGSNVTNLYDALNRLTNMVDGVGTDTLTYTGLNQLASEGGYWASDEVSFSYTNHLRQQLSLLQPGGASPWVQNYTYDTSGRLSHLTTSAEASGFAYYYDPTHKLEVGGLWLGSFWLMTNTFDTVGRNIQKLDRLGGEISRYDLAGQRIALTNGIFTTSRCVTNNYDSVGQLVLSYGAEPGNPFGSRLQEKFLYHYDPAGNLITRTNNDLVQTFGVNSLNELTTIGRSGTMTVAGMATMPPYSITINGLTNVDVYFDDTFAKAGFDPSLTNLTVVVGDSFGRSSTNSLSINLPSSVSYQYDANGNMISDSRRGFTYDTENQLIQIVVTNQWKSEFKYDGFGRRRVRQEYNWVSGNWSLASETRYVYDGMLAIQERDGNNAVKVTYTRGLDKSGTLQGAGGIGGLLARTENTSYVMPSSYYISDVSGNVAGLVNIQGTIVARYVYDPFGRTIGMSGWLADANPYRFSSKEQDGKSGLYYYGYRFYEPNLQRWLNQDPLGERGGINLYRFNYNAPINFVDPNGSTPLGAAIGGAIGGGLGTIGGGTLGFIGGTLALPGVGSVTVGVAGADAGFAVGAGLGIWAGNIISDSIENYVNFAGKKDRFLPASGTCPYVPKKQKGGGNPRNKAGDYIDDAGNGWRWDPVKGEWDVQHPDGSHTNVGPDGEITHGPNNF